MNRKVLRIGIMPYHDYQKRSLAIARGEYRPQPNEPKIWFESVQWHQIPHLPQTSQREVWAWTLKIDSY
ncbi:MAG: hypothetical protein Q8K00_11775 [Syntrophales bacterium]|nr:hypothetical protein [Syntrophales bacterium]